MPGLLATTVSQGYDYVSPYVEKAQPYVEKARNTVPLVDPALKTAEEIVPALITRADQLAEPQVVRMRPYVEPRIEQVKEKVAPYVDEGIKQYGVLCKEGVKYYNVGLEKVEQVKEYKDAKETQIRDFAEPKINGIKEFTEAKTTQIREFTDPKVEKIKEFTEAKTTQIKKFADPKVEKIKEFMEPKVAVITARQRKMQKIFRVPATLDLQGLNYESLLGKIASALEKFDTFMDKYIDLPEDQKKEVDRYSENSCASDNSCGRINRSVVSIVTKPIAALTMKMMLLFSLMKAKTLTLKSNIQGKVATTKAAIETKATSIVKLSKGKVATTKAAIETKASSIVKQISAKLAPKVATAAESPLFKKAKGFAVSGSEKVLGKEKTATILSKIDTYVPVAWKPAPATKKSK